MTWDTIIGVTFTNPFFWALACMGGILASTALATTHELGWRTSLRVLAGLLFVVGSVGLVGPWCPQPRLVLPRPWHVAGGLLGVLAAGVFTVASSGEMAGEFVCLMAAVV